MTAPSLATNGPFESKKCTTRCSECQCCAYGTLLPLLPGILTSLASLFSLTSWDCNSEWLVSVLLIAILILVLLPACIRYRQPRGVRISLYIAAVLSFLCAVLKVFGALYYVEIATEDSDSEEGQWAWVDAVLCSLAAVLWIISSIVITVLACVKVEERKPPPEALYAVDPAETNIVELSTMMSPSGRDSTITHIPDASITIEEHASSYASRFSTTPLASTRSSVASPSTQDVADVESPVTEIPAANVIVESNHASGQA